MNRIDLLFKVGVVLILVGTVIVAGFSIQLVFEYLVSLPLLNAVMWLGFIFIMTGLVIAMIAAFIDDVKRG